MLMKLPCDPLNEFARLSIFCVNPIALVAHPVVGALTVAELVADLRGNAIHGAAGLIA